VAPHGDRMFAASLGATNDALVIIIKEPAAGNLDTFEVQAAALVGGMHTNLTGQFRTIDAAISAQDGVGSSIQAQLGVGSVEGSYTSPSGTTTFTARDATAANSDAGISIGCCGRVGTTDRCCTGACPCPSLSLGSACTRGSDCASGNCGGNCENEEQAIPDGFACSEADDCASGNCALRCVMTRGGFCIPPEYWATSGGGLECGETAESTFGCAMYTSTCEPAVSDPDGTAGTGGTAGAGGAGGFAGSGGNSGAAGGCDPPCTDGNVCTPGGYCGQCASDADCQPGRFAESYDDNFCGRPDTLSNGSRCLLDIVYESPGEPAVVFSACICQTDADCLDPANPVCGGSYCGAPYQCGPRHMCDPTSADLNLACAGNSECVGGTCDNISCTTNADCPVNASCEVTNDVIAPMTCRYL
jgi:hypothetical protein